jgi:hypothetical protein
MAFTRGTPNLREAARVVPTGKVNNHLLSALGSITKDINDLKARAGTQAIDFDKRSPVAQPPGLASIAVKPVPGIFTVVVTNPENVVPSGPLKATPRNPVRAPVLHRITFSLTPNFDGTSDVRVYGPSTQTHWTIADIPSSSRYVRLESSFDGENWNKASLSGPFQN